MMKQVLTALLWGSVLAVVTTGASLAEDRRITLAAPAGLVETGFLRHLLPRFSLKNSISVRVVGLDVAADARLGVGPMPGTPAVFVGGPITYHLVAPQDAEANALVERLMKWLHSDPGAAAIESFAGPPSFSVPETEARVDVAEPLPGDVLRGKSLSYDHCGRCHVIGEENRMDGAGNTPSFAVLRTLPDWQIRFAGYYALNPHPAFTRIDGVSDPDSAGRTPTIAPVELTLEDLEDMIAFAASVAPANLGAPIKHQ
jgi:mono/diheme cytochrome c family protein